MQNHPNQASNLCPLLFSNNDNDLPNVSKNVNTFMFADDTVIFPCGNSLHEPAQQLSLALDDL